MADITWENVTALAPELSTVPEARQNFILARVNTELAANVWGDRLDIGRVYLAAHLATRSNAGAGGGVAPAGPVTSESVGSVSRSYAAPAGSSASDYKSTVYGEEYANLVKQLPGARIAIAPAGCVT